MSKIDELSFDSKSFFLPSHSIKIHRSQFDKQLSSRLAEIILLEEFNILVKTKKPEHEKDASWLTGRLNEYNLFDFDYPEIKEFKSFVRNQFINYAKNTGHAIPNKTYIQCWANILRTNGRKITAHHHCTAHSDAPQEYAYVSGNICVQATHTMTYYKNPFNELYHGIYNKNGELILFPSYVVHWTDKNNDYEPRISIAFDIITDEVYNIIDNKNFRELT